VGEDIILLYMKKYLNLALSFVLYVIAIILFFGQSSLKEKHLYMVAGLSLLLIVLGLLLGLRSGIKKELVVGSRIVTGVGLILFLIIAAFPIAYLAFSLGFALTV
jgi:hypothetical protein